ncbi:MAG: transcriptional regulator, AraC family [Fibrobacteres bacterium]|nr:transcriptional regulator, AraC family [Fibrobacterota bacterium]
MQTIALGHADGQLDRLQWKPEGGVRLELLGFVSFPEGYRGALHSHPFWELVFIGAGKGSLRHDRGSIPCGAGDIILIPSGGKHQFQADPLSAFDQLYIGFSFDFAVPEAMEARPPQVLPGGALNGMIQSELASNLGLLRDKPQGHAMEAIRGRLLSVVSRVIGLHLLQEAPPRSDNPRSRESLMRLAREFLFAHLQDGEGAAQLARHFCLSPRYFGELFKRETGMSIKEFQCACRMERAKALLSESGLSITDVAGKVGIEDLAYFSRLFKKHFGISPRQSRSLPPD